MPLSSLSKTYASQSAEDILSKTDELKDLIQAFVMHAISNKHKSAIQILSKILEKTDVDSLSEHVDDALQAEENIDVKQRQALGRLFRSLFPAFSKIPMEVTEGSELSEQDFAYVVGTSNVRGFGSTPYYFPIFSYIGRQSFVLSDDMFKSCYFRTAAILERLIPGKPILLVLGSEPRLLLENVFKLREHEFGGNTKADFEYMEISARRYAELGEALQKVAKGPLNFLVPMPTFDDDTNELSRHMIKHLYQYLEGTDIGLIDPFDAFVDTDTGHMYEDLQIVKKEGELHFNHDGLMRITSCMVEKGFASPDVITDEMYQWNHLFQINMGNKGEVRIWSDPARSLKSDMAAAAIVSENLCDFIAGHFAQKPSSSTLVLNSYQGFLAYCIPFKLSEKIYTVCPNQLDVQSAQRLFQFTGREEIVPCTKENLQSFITDGKVESLIVHIMPYDDVDDVNADIKAAIDDYNPERVFIYLAEGIEPPSIDQSNYQLVSEGEFKNRHLPECWQTHRLFFFNLDK